MQFNEIYERTKYAFEHDEVFELLTGKKGYSYQAPKYVASVPTCDEFVFRDGIYPYYNSLGDAEKQNALHKISSAVDKMISSEDPTLLWWALSILQGQKDQESYFNHSPFRIADIFWDRLSVALTSNKNSLVANQSYMGRGHANGLWGEVRRIAFLLDKDYGVHLSLGD